MSDQEIKSAAEALLNKCRDAKLMISTAESCTGGLIAAALTSVAGSSQVFTCGMVTYSNKAKMKLLSVPRELLKTEGAVSIFCARAMAEGGLEAGKRRPRPFFNRHRRTRRRHHRKTRRVDLYRRRNRRTNASGHLSIWRSIT